MDTQSIRTEVWLSHRWQECGRGAGIERRESGESKVQRRLKNSDHIPYYKRLKSLAMSPLTLRTDFGCTEAVIDDDCGLKRFYEVANILSDDLDIKFTQKTDDFDSLMWDFMYKGHILTLHYNIYTGISIYPRKFREAPRKDNDAVVEVAKFLEGKLLINTAKRYMS
jgi:hypothetical protein